MRLEVKPATLGSAITLADYFMGRDCSHANELSGELRTNAALTVARANALLERAGFAGIVNSGWRPHAINAAIPRASARSKHLTCQAIDLDDLNDALDTWCLHNLCVLEDLGLWLEHPDATPGWCHVQIVPPRSGRRMFMP
jgi:hypothetical protein